MKGFVVAECEFCESVSLYAPGVMSANLGILLMWFPCEFCLFKN